MNDQAVGVPILSFNVPNVVTGVRVVLTLAIVWLLIQGGTANSTLAGILLIIAWASDGLDGHMARRLGQSTRAGMLFDVVADRMLMTPVLILSIMGGFWTRTAGLMPFSPYPYAIVVIAGDIALLAGVFVFLWKCRTSTIEFPSPTQIAKITFSFQMIPLIVCIFGVGPDILLASLMYLAIIFTLLSFYSYLKKGSYVFTS